MCTRIEGASARLIVHAERATASPQRLIRRRRPARRTRACPGTSGRWHPRLAGLAVDVSQSDSGGRDVHRAEDDGQVKPARADRAGIEDGEITIASDEGDV